MSAENALLQYEAGQNAAAMAALTDSGDRTTFTSPVALWSRRSGFAPVVRPNGLLTGGAVIPAAAAGVDDVDIAALTCNLNGVVTSVAAAADQEITRPASNAAKVNSITVNSSGSIAIVAGTDGSDTSFSETRGAAGGPPYIPVDSIEIGQVRVTSSTSAPITADQVFTVDGLHVERAINPGFDIDYQNGQVTFLSALPAIHTGDEPKAVYASYASPIFAEQQATDYQPSANSHTVNSTQIYGRTRGSTSSTLNGGTFTAYLEDGVNDPIVALADEVLWFRFYPDRTKSGYILDQGKLGMTLSYPADDDITAACTIAASTASTRAVA